MDLMSAHLELQIDRLVLHGFAPGDRLQIGEAVQQELTRLFAQGIPPSLMQSGQIERQDGGTFELTAGATEGIGVQIAQAIYHGLDQ
jgi:hypothetical protein